MPSVILPDGSTQEVPANEVVEFLANLEKDKSIQQGSKLDSVDAHIRELRLIDPVSPQLLSRLSSTHGKLTELLSDWAGRVVVPQAESAPTPPSDEDGDEGTDVDDSAKPDSLDLSGASVDPFVDVEVKELPDISKCPHVPGAICNTLSNARKASLAREIASTPSKEHRKQIVDDNNICETCVKEWHKEWGDDS